MRRLGVLIALLAALAATAADLRPAVAPARAGTRCVEDPALMRRAHMGMLQHQRDDTVRGGVRGAKHSLKDCVDCHAGAASSSVAAQAGDFCVACHRYAAVTIDCFECHSARPRAAVAKAGS